LESHIFKSEKLKNDLFNQKTLNEQSIKKDKYLGNLITKIESKIELYLNDIETLNNKNEYILKK